MRIIVHSVERDFQIIKKKPGLRVGNGKLLCDLKKVTFPRKLFKEIWCTKLVLTAAHAFTLYDNPGS